MSLSAHRLRLLGACAGAAALAAGTVPVNAATLTGPLSISIYWQDPGNVTRSSTNANEQALNTNPMLTASPSDLIYTGTFSGPLNLNIQMGDTNSILSFLNSGVGTSVSSPNAALNNKISTTNFDITTLIVITGNTDGATWSGTITHDDGVGLYDSSGTLITAPVAAEPTTSTTNDFSGLTGPFTLYFVQANGLPSVLDFQYTVTEPAPTPLPPSLWMFGSVLAGGIGIGRWRKRRKAA